MRLTNDAGGEFIKELPDSPGVYRYYDKAGELLYVGKANSLLKRVKSYFQKSMTLSPRIFLMVSKIHEIEITVTENETSALLLENNLIKTLKPRYNIIFRDDKSYPSLRISGHEYPRIEYFRGKSATDGMLFGPYPNATAVRESLDFLQKLFKLRTCNDASFANRSRACMLHQINLCSAPCVNKINRHEYRQNIDAAQEFLSGNYAHLIEQIAVKMYQAAENLDFEEAGIYRDQITMLKQLQSRQIISDSQTPLNCDIVLFRESDGWFFAYIILVRNGLYVGDKHFDHRLGCSFDELNQAFWASYYADGDTPQLVFTSHLPDSQLQQLLHSSFKLNLRPIGGGRIYELMQMGLANLEKIIEKIQIDHIYQAAANKLAQLLQLAIVVRVECYDTSHLQGNNAVASMVVYSAGKINHSLYRRYNLPQSINGDDLAALEYTLRRRLGNQELPLPEIILVDGGELQLKCTKNLLSELGLCGKIKAIAIFKGDNRDPLLDQIILSDKLRLEFRKEPLLFRFLQALRDEAHRFAITGHRKKQANQMSRSRLDDVPGIGAARRKMLIAFLGSAEAVAAASIEELQQVKGVGLNQALKIYNYFHK